MAFGADIKNVVVKFAADLTKFDQAINSMQAKLENASKKMTSIGKKMTAAITIPLVGLSVLAVKEAANMQGAMDKFNVVFRGGTDEMLEWVEAYRKEFPLAKQEIIKFSADLQGLIVPMGVNRSQAAQMTKEWMHLAGALSAFHDVPMEEALNAIRSGISGQSEPLKRFGIVLSEAKIEEEALRLGLIKTGQEMSSEVKQMAILSLAYRQSADAVNGLEEQKGSLLWQLQELQATYKEFMLDLGNLFLPIVQKIIPKIQEWANKFRGLNDTQKRIIVIIGAVVAAIGPLLLGLGLAAKAGTILAGAMGLIFSPVTIVIAAIAGFIALVVHLYNSNEEFRNFVNEAWTEIKEHITSIIESIVKYAKQYWAEFGDDIKALWSIIQEHFINNFMLIFDTIKHVFGLVAALIKGDWTSIWEEAKAIFGNYIKFIEDKIDFIKKIFSTIKKAIEDAFNFSLEGSFKAMVNSAVATFNKVITWINNNLKIKLPEILGGETYHLVSIPKIPELAEGGIVMPRPGGVLAKIAEAGKPEAVIPLDRLGKDNGVVNIQIDISGKRLVQALGVPLMREIRIRG